MPDEQDRNEVRGEHPIDQGAAGFSRPGDRADGFGGHASPASGYGGGYANPTPEPTAVAALVLSIAAFVVCPVVFAIIALVLARTAQRTIDQSGGGLTGLPMVKAARWIAWIHLGLVVVALVLFTGLLAFGRSGASTTYSLGLLWP